MHFVFPPGDTTDWCKTAVGSMNLSYLIAAKGNVNIRIPSDKDIHCSLEVELKNVTGENGKKDKIRTITCT